MCSKCTLAVLAALSGLAFPAASATSGGQVTEWRLETVQYQLGRSYLGITVTDIDSDRAGVLQLGDPRGVEVRRVQENSPAQQAGLKAGDVLLTYNSEEVLSSPQLQRLVSETPPGHKVKVDYWRAGKQRVVVIKLAAPEIATNDATVHLGSSQPIGTSDIPRMLMLWDNFTLGVECEPIDTQLAKYFGVSGGILIRQVATGMSADRAGIRAGDVITSIDTRSVGSPRDLISYLRTEHLQGKQVSVSVIRDRKPRSFTVRLPE